MSNRLTSVVVGPSAPPRAIVGQLWVDTSGATPVLKRCTVAGTTFVEVNDQGTSEIVIVPAVLGKAGAAAGWVTTGVNESAARLPQSQTAATFTIPLSGLSVGDTIVNYRLRGQIESGGNAATVDCKLVKTTIAAADIVLADVSNGAITQVSATADAAISATLAAPIAQAVAAGEMYHLLVTATTGEATDAVLVAVELTVLRG